MKAKSCNVITESPCHVQNDGLPSWWKGLAQWAPVLAARNAAHFATLSLLRTSFLIAASSSTKCLFNCLVMHSLSLKAICSNIDRVWAYTACGWDRERKIMDEVIHCDRRKTYILQDDPLDPPNLRNLLIHSALQIKSQALYFCTWPAKDSLPAPWHLWTKYRTWLRR